MTQISDVSVGYPRLYKDSHAYSLHTIFFAPNSPGFWLSGASGPDPQIGSANVASEAAMDRKWPDERLIEDPAEVRSYLRQLPRCRVGGLETAAELDAINKNWRHSLEDLA